MFSTIGDKGEFDKERLRRALAGALYAGEDGEGNPSWAEGGRAECEAEVLEVFDSWVSMAKDLADAGRAMERVAQRNGVVLADHLQEYVEERARAAREFDDYVYEDEIRELHEQAREALGGAR